MELGNKIRMLRLRAGLTQEMLAEEMGVSFQTISKWENNVCAPDISMLPKLSVYFGVTIDEMFDLTTEQRLHRIEKMLDMERELPGSTFAEVEEFLAGLLETEENKTRINSFLARLYYHRVSSDSEKIDKYARRAMWLRPDVKDCQWLLQTTEGAVAKDWNISNHHRVITFYKELIREYPQIAPNYLYLIDNLLADNRTREAGEYLQKYSSLEGHEEYRKLVYQGKIALAEHKVQEAEEIFRELEKRFPEHCNVAFELANHYAMQCDYEKALHYYEKSFALDIKQGNHPVFIDALEAMVLIYEIQGRYDKALAICDRELEHLKEEFGFTEGEPVRKVAEKKQELYEKQKVKGEKMP